MTTQDFESIKERLDQIVDAVKDDDLPIDQALSLYEEAVGLGLKASSLLEESVFAQEDADDASASAQDGAAEAGNTQDASANSGNAASAEASAHHDESASADAGQVL